MFRLIRHVFSKHLAPTLVIFLLVAFGLGVNKTLAPISGSNELTEEKNVSNQSLPVIVTKRSGPALFDVQIGPVIESENKNRKLVPFGVVGLILLIAAIYAFIYKKIHHPR